MAGIIYYKLSPANYHNYMIGYDYTKNTSLTGGEIDSNFHFLEGKDVYSLQMNGQYLDMLRVNGQTESVKITPYTTSCGISISDENEIGLNLRELGAISCFDNEVYTSVGCGLAIGTEDESCTGFNEFLIRMLGTNTALRYIALEIQINGQYYGGVTPPNLCDVTDCTGDQFYQDYLQYLKSGFIKIDVCGIVCEDNCNARINVDNDTIKLDDCKLKVNYGCGLTIHDEETEQDYINFLSENWETLVGEPEQNKLECYLDGTLQINGYYYDSENFKDDQFYTGHGYEFNTTLNVDLNENGGLICTNNGISVDYGCGLEIRNNGTFEGFIYFLDNFLGIDQSHSVDNPEDIYVIADITENCENDNVPCHLWTNDVHYNSYVECFNSGALSVSLHNNNGLFCIGGKIGLNLGCGLEIEELTACCLTDEDSEPTDYSYLSFLSDHFEELTGMVPGDYNDQDSNIYQYWNGTLPIGCEYFGGERCPVAPCNPCDKWFNDQFFCDYVSYINAGRLIVKLGNGLTCDSQGIRIVSEQ